MWLKTVNPEEKGAPLSLALMEPLDDSLCHEFDSDAPELSWPFGAEPFDKIGPNATFSFAF
jgi:hypothetical protein